MNINRTKVSSKILMYPSFVMNLRTMLHAIDRMLSFDIRVLVVLFFFLFNCQSAQCFDFPSDVPIPKKFVIHSNIAALVDNSTKVLVPTFIQTEYPSLFAQFKSVAKGFPVSKRPVEHIEFSLVSPQYLANYISGQMLVLFLTSEEGYVILIRNFRLKVISNTHTGLLRGGGDSSIHSNKKSW